MSINWKCGWGIVETGNGGGHKLELWFGIYWSYGWAPIGTLSEHYLELRVATNWSWELALIGNMRGQQVEMYVGYNWNYTIHSFFNCSMFIPQLLRSYTRSFAFSHGE